MKALPAVDLPLNIVSPPFDAKGFEDPVLAEMETLVIFERAKVAVSPDPLGTVTGVQFVAVFQSPEPGLRSHVALPACAITESKNMRALPLNAAINFFTKLILRLVLPMREDYQRRKPPGRPYGKS